MNLIGAVFSLYQTEMILILLGQLFPLILVSAASAILAHVVLRRIPQVHRKQEPVLAFLLLIPVFSLVWGFFVHPRVAESLHSYFSSAGDESRDCGRPLALLFCVCSLGTFVPVLGHLSAVAALVFLILFYVRAFELSGRIAENGKKVAAAVAEQ